MWQTMQGPAQKHAGAQLSFWLIPVIKKVYSQVESMQMPVQLDLYRSVTRTNELADEVSGGGCSSTLSTTIWILRPARHRADSQYQIPSPAWEDNGDAASCAAL